MSGDFEKPNKADNYSSNKDDKKEEQKQTPPAAKKEQKLVEKLEPLISQKSDPPKEQLKE